MAPTVAGEARGAGVAEVPLATVNTFSRWSRSRTSSFTRFLETASISSRWFRSETSFSARFLDPDNTPFSWSRSASSSFTCSRDRARFVWSWTCPLTSRSSRSWERASSCWSFATCFAEARELRSLKMASSLSCIFSSASWWSRTDSWYRPRKYRTLPRGGSPPSWRALLETRR